MINPEREGIFLGKQNQRNPLRRAIDVFNDTIVTAVAERASKRTPEMTYAFPDRQDNITKWYSREFFSYFPNPHNLDLHGIAQERVERARLNGKVATRADRKLKGGRVVVRTDHVGDLVEPGFLNYDETVIRAVGLEALVSKIITGSQRSDESSFRRLRYGPSEPIDLVHEDGTSVLLHTLFGDPPHPLPVPLPVGSVLLFENGEHALKATILPITGRNEKTGKDNIVGYVSLIGPVEKSNLDLVMSRTRKKGGRILVAYKEGNEGIAHGFIQPDPGYTDVYELVDDDKTRVKSFNGQPPPYKTLPEPEPGTLQIVLTRTKGKIETFVRGETDAPEFLRDAAANYGLDVVEWGTSSAKEALVPINFKQGGVSHIDGKIILQWQKEDERRYLEYINANPGKTVHDFERIYEMRYLNYLRENAIMPVQPAMVEVERRESSLPSTNGIADHATVYQAVEDRSVLHPGNN